MPISAIAFAEQILTASGAFTNAQTVVVGGKTYTTQTTLTDTDGNVLIGANAEATLQNLFDAINLTGTPGTQYAASMTINPHVTAVDNDATTLTVRSKIAGTMGNLIASTETQTNAAWGAATLAGGTGNIDVAISEILSSEQVNSSVAQILRDLRGLVE